jgi:hypothetical protein
MNENKSARTGISIDRLDIRRVRNGFILMLPGYGGMMNEGEYVALTAEDAGKLVAQLMTDKNGDTP